MTRPTEVADVVRDFLGPAIVFEAVQVAEGRDNEEIECPECGKPIIGRQDASLIATAYPYEKSGEAALVHRACRKSQIIEMRTPKEEKEYQGFASLLRAIKSPPPPETIGGKLWVLYDRIKERWRGRAG